jgi:hypothetical protein
VRTAPRAARRSSSPGGRVVVALAMSCALGAALVVAWNQPGFPAVPPLPVDRSVWVVNGSDLLIGRINPDIGQLDSAVQVRANTEVVQEPNPQAPPTVLVADQRRHELQVLDTTTVTLGARVRIPDVAAVQVGSGTLAVADQADGRLWVGAAAAAESVDARVATPVATLGAQPAMTVSAAGTVFAVAPGGDAIVRAGPGATPTNQPLPRGPLSLGGLSSTGAAGSLAGIAGGSTDAPGANIQITAVGQTPVVLDRADSSIRVDDRRLVLPDLPGAVLQHSGPAAPEVLIASTAGLVAVRLDDGTVRTLSTATGAPTAPLVAGSCYFGAWLSPTGQRAGAWAVASCADQAASQGASPADPVALPGSQDAATLVLRQRDDAVVLADNLTGRSWVATDNFRLVDNWLDVAPANSDIDDTSTVDDPTTSTDLPELPPDCTAVPVGAPTTEDDEFGVRAGRATVLRVLDNDPSVDCTSVVIDSVSTLPPEWGSVAIVDAGSAIQVTVPPTASGVLPAIEYQVGNGKSGTATGRVLIEVVSDQRSEPPERVRRSASSIEVNGTVTYNVLDDFGSPAGDDLFLLSAVTDGPGEVSFRPDGAITFRSDGTGAGTDAVVRFVVADGLEQTAGVLTVAIAPAASTTPVAYPVYTRAVVGSPAIAEPSRHVVSAATAPVIIDSVLIEPGSEGATAEVDSRTGTVTVGATRPGTYYLTFEAAAGDRAVTGVLRADFIEPGDAAGAVVPMADVAYLPAGEQAVIDPLANDTDPDGQGLAIREVAVPPGSPVTAAVVDLRLVRLSAARGPSATVVFDYAVFDGAGTGTGQIRIVPVPARRSIPPPLASAITATVRAGDAVTIPIARYATSQDGSPVTAELDAAQVAELPGRAFVTGDTIRYLAPAEPPNAPVTFSYTAVAGSSTPLRPVQTVSTVTITVTAASDGPNAAPGPPLPATARVFTDAAVTISLPLAGSDPDGDWVVLQSLVLPESALPESPLGEVTISGPDTLSYRAFGAAGVDRLRYLATDPAGQQVTGELTVLVTPPGELARPPVAADLDVAVRPGGRIRIDPLETAVDPGGLPMTLAAPAFTAAAGLQVQVDGQSLIITAPTESTVASLRYAVVNSKGLGASGAVRITVSEDAPMPAPLARDVFVRPADLAADKETVDVDVSGYVTNRSGQGSELAVAVDPLSADRATMAGPQTIRVTVGPVRSIVAYQVTDVYGAGATALIVVPPQQQLVGPQLIGDAGPIRVAAGERVDVDIEEYVAVGGGAVPMIAPSPALRATQGTATRMSASTLSLSVPSGAGGQAALYVPIDDGTGAVTVMTLPVQIEPRLVPPPRLESTAVQVGAGAAVVVDLAALTTTFDRAQADSISYTVPGVERLAGRGLQVEVDGNALTLSARADVPRGSRFEVPVRVLDGEGRDGRAVVSITVTGSTLPLPTVLDQQVPQGRAGVEVAVDLLSGSNDPVGLGLTVTGVSVSQGAAGIATGPTLTGSTVRLVPAAGYPGEIVLTADITDGTSDPERMVRAAVRITIQDRPSAPGAPTVVPGTLTARGVQLRWAPAEANGAQIQGYTVTGNGVQQDCPGVESSCYVGGLQPGLGYVLVVTARNEVGTSPPSAPSATIVPNAAPTAPAAPTATYVARGQLSVSFVAPTGDFTPVTAMSLRVVRGEEVVQVLDAVTSPVLLTDLDAAAGYRFAVRAANEQGAGDWSADSAALRPSGTPSPPSQLDARFVYDADRRGIQITWAPPTDDGGEPVQGYRLLLDNVETASGGSDFLAHFVPTAGSGAVTVAVIARNSRGEGPAATGVSAVPFSRPPAVTGLSASGVDGAVELSWNPVEGQGSPIAGYDYRVDGGGWVPAGSATTTTVGGLTNGIGYRFEVRACNGATDYPEDVRCGPAGDAASATPFGALAAPSVSAALERTWGESVTATWSFPDGNGREITARSVQIRGAVTADPDVTTGSWTGDIGFGASVTVTVRYCVAAAEPVCAEKQTQSPSTATAVPLPTIALDPLTGTCGAAEPYAGAWRTQDECGSGTWVVAPATVAVLCTTSGPSYPAVPPVGPDPGPIVEADQWYLAAGDRWFRAGAVDAGGRATIPPCD